MQCDTVCVLGPSKCCGIKRVPDCMAWLGFRSDHIQKPCGCAFSRTVRYPVKIPVDKKVPKYTCVAETVCCGCGKCCTASTANEQQTLLAVEQARALGVLPVADKTEVLLASDVADLKVAR
ncbi:MAG TPA: hypothetical protein VG713_07540 [Pirellulales bacterium]|nr:hypothetical protein [Pirellulales bacterium]